LLHKLSHPSVVTSIGREWLHTALGQEPQEGDLGLGVARGALDEVTHLCHDEAGTPSSSSG
jgi:hypothetical protein